MFWVRNLRKSLTHTNNLNIYLVLILPLLAFSCRQGKYQYTEDSLHNLQPLSDSVKTEISPETSERSWVPPPGFSEILPEDTTFILDLRYADTANFTKTKLYDCPKCVLKTEVLERLKTAAKVLSNKGLRLVLLDCYRPAKVQEKMWKIKPDPHFVMRPWKGSAHTRAIAVDVTLADKDGIYLDMGSDFDEFTSKSFYASKNISKQAQSNRWILRSAMKQAGFSGIRTEWWHFQAGLSKNHDLQEFEWSCE